MSDTIGISWDQLLSQAHTTGKGYVEDALRFVKEEIGTKKSKSTLEEMRLAIEIARIFASDFHSTSISVMADKLNSGLSYIGEAIRDRE